VAVAARCRANAAGSFGKKEVLGRPAVVGTLDKARAGPGSGPAFRA
jgi:hypothetical protein